MNIGPHTIVIENKKGSYKSFEIEGDPVWLKYPLAGVTYPVDYGYIEGYVSEDGHDLDVFVGSGDATIGAVLNGYIRVWRYDVPEETKMFMNLTQEELDAVIAAFKPVLVESRVLDGASFEAKMKEFI